MDEQLKKDIEENEANLKIRPGQSYILVITNPDGKWMLKSNENMVTVNQNLLNMHDHLKKNLN